MARREGAEKVGRVLKGTTKSISFHLRLAVQIIFLGSSALRADAPIGVDHRPYGPMLHSVLDHRPYGPMLQSVLGHRPYGPMLHSVLGHRPCGPMLQSVFPAAAGLGGRRSLDPNLFGVGKLSDTMRPEFAAEAGTFNAATGQPGIGLDDAIDGDLPGLDLVGKVERAFGIRPKRFRIFIHANTRNDPCLSPRLDGHPTLCNRFR